MIEQRPPPGTLPGEWEPPVLSLCSSPDAPLLRVHEYALLARGVFSADSCESLAQAMAGSGQASPVSVSGHPSGDNDIGSVRATAWSPALAAELWRHLESFIPRSRTMTDVTPTDWYAHDGRLAHRHWRSFGIGPVLRFMRYDWGGRHCAHYDMGFDYPDRRRSLMSLVIYLSDVFPGEGGTTRIVDDGQRHMPVWERNHEDWTREVTASEVTTKVRPSRGDVFLFDHRLCHDVERYQGSTGRVIVRGDVVFEALDAGVDTN